MSKFIKYQIEKYKNFSMWAKQKHTEGKTHKKHYIFFINLILQMT